MRLQSVLLATALVLILGVGLVGVAAADPGNASQFTFSYSPLGYDPGDVTYPGGNAHSTDITSYGVINATDDRIDGVIYFVSQCQTVHDRGDWGPCEGKFWIEQGGERVWDGVYHYRPFDDERAGSTYRARGLGLNQGLTMVIEAPRVGPRYGYIRDGGN